MIKVSAPIDRQEFHSLEAELDGHWWAQILCTQIGETCCGLLLQHHDSPITGPYAGVYRHTDELIVGILSARSPVELGQKMASLNGETPDLSMSTSVRKMLRLLGEGYLEAPFKEACRSRNVTSVTAGTDVPEFADMIRTRLETNDFTPEMRKSDSGEAFHVWTKSYL